MNKQLIPELLISMILISMFISGLNVQLTKAEPATIVVPDDYATIQDAINHALDSDAIHVKPGIYYEHVIVNKTVFLIGEDVSTTIIDGNNTGHVISIIRSNVNITGFTIQRSGNVHMPALDAGICLNSTTDCTISENRLIDNGFAGISLLYSDQNKIVHNNLSSTGWGGIHLLGSSRNIVSGNSITDKYGGINGHASSHYNNFTENVISNSTYGMFYNNANYNNILRNSISDIAVEGIWLQDQVNYNIVAENTLINNTVAIRLQGPNYYNTLSRNVITGAQYGVKIEAQANRNTVSGNIITSCQFGIQVLNAIYTDIYNNTIAHNYGSDWDAGIRLDSASYTRIYSNLITDNWRGILLYTSSPRVSIYNNNVTDNEYAIRVASGGSSYVNVSGNYVANNHGYGIGLTGFGGASNYATIARNLIVNNTLEAVSLGQGSKYNTIVQNNMIENGYGIYFDLVGYSTQNTIFNNNIINNTQQIRIAPGSVNAWDGRYLSGGNYWSNYTGADLYKGPDQNLTGSDGIGDTSHVIDANNRDNYPLMNPYPWTSHDVGITSVTTSKTVVGQGYNVSISIMTFNYGNYQENINITIYANTTIIGELNNIAIGSRSPKILTFAWNTSGFSKGNYVLSAHTWPVLGETDLDDNSCTDDFVTITIPGDCAGASVMEPPWCDGKVFWQDLLLELVGYGVTSADPKWISYYLARADFNNDNQVFWQDLLIVQINYGKTNP